MVNDPKEVEKARRILASILYVDINGFCFVRDQQNPNEKGLAIPTFIDTLQKMQAELTYTGFVGFDKNGNPKYERS